MIDRKPAGEGNGFWKKTSDKVGDFQDQSGISSKAMVYLVIVALIAFNCSIIVVKLASAIVFVLRPLIIQYYVKKKYHIDSSCAEDKKLLEKARRMIILSSKENDSILCSVKNLEVVWGLF